MASELTVLSLTPPSVGSGGGLLQALTNADAAGQKFVNDGKTFILAQNNHGSDITVTPLAQVSVPGATVAGQAVTITTATTKLLGPYDPNVWNYQSGNDLGKMEFISSVSNSNIKFAAVKMP